MSDDRKLLWVQVFTAFSAVWPWFKPNVETLAVWDAALGDMSVQEIAEGAARVLANHTGQAQPTPGDIRAGAHGKPTWQPIVRQLDGRVIGRRQMRDLNRTLHPAPQQALTLLTGNGRAEIPESTTREDGRR